MTRLSDPKTINPAPMSSTTGDDDHDICMLQREWHEAVHVLLAVAEQVDGRGRPQDTLIIDHQMPTSGVSTALIKGGGYCKPQQPRLSRQEEKALSEPSKTT